MRQAIVTKYIGPTDHRGARVKATAAALAITVSWDHSLDVSANHTAAARELADKLGWTGQWCGGGLPLGGGNCYVCIPLSLCNPHRISDDGNFFVVADRIDDDA